MYIHEIYALKWLAPRTLQGYQVGLVVVIVTPQNILHKHCCQFFLGGCNTKEKRKTKVMQNFGKQIRCIMGDLQVVNKTKNVVVFGRKMVWKGPKSF